MSTWTTVRWVIGVVFFILLAVNMEKMFDNAAYVLWVLVVIIIWCYVCALVYYFELNNEPLKQVEVKNKPQINEGSDEYKKPLPKRLRVDLDL